MDATLDILVQRVQLWTGHPATDAANPDVVPTGGVFSRNDLELLFEDARVDVTRFPLDYTLAQNMAGATTVWSTLTWWASDAILQSSNWTVITPDTPRPDIGRWDFDTPQQYPLYITGRSYDLHRVCADLLDAWAAKVKLEHNLSIGDLSLSRNQKYEMLTDLAEKHRKRSRWGSFRVVDDSVLSTPGSGNAYREATQPPPM